MKILLFIIALTCGITTTFSQFAIDVQAKGSANSTWLLNKNISDLGASQDYAMGWGSTYGIAANVYTGIIGLGIEFNYAVHNGAYEGVITDPILNSTLDTYNSNVNLKTLQIPLLLKFQSEGGSYIEFGPQLTNISSATYTRSGTTPIGTYESEKDVSEEYNGSYLSGVLGFGAKIPLGEDFPVGVLIGIRLQYSFGDLMGVDGYGYSLGSEDNPPSSILYDSHQPTQAVSGGIVIGATYTIK